MLKALKNFLLRRQLTNVIETCYVALVFKYYQDSSNNDLWLTLTFLLWQGQIWENARTYDFMGSFEVFGLKISIYSLFLQ